MIRAEKIYVDTDEGRFTLSVVTEDNDRLTIDIHDDVLAFYQRVKLHIGPYVDEAESARRDVSADWPQPIVNRPISVEDAIDAGYALDDPKSPGYHDRMVD